MINEELLQSIGVHKNEGKIYLASLELGPASAIQLAKKVGLSRQMVYVILDSLLGKGLVKEVKIDKHQYFQALAPEVLTDRVETISKKIKEIVPVLKTRQAQFAAIPLITVYENPLAMREWYRQYIKEVKKDDELLIWSTGNINYWYGLDKEFYEKYMDHSDKVGAWTYLIEPDVKETLKHDKIVARPHTKYKRFKNAWRTNAEKWIWKNQVCFLTIRENATNMIVIESKDLAEIERFDFWRIWNKN